MWLVEAFTAPGDLVINPCLGSGTVTVTVGYPGCWAIGTTNGDGSYDRFMVGCERRPRRWKYGP